MDFFTKNDYGEVHPYIPELKGQLEKGDITRREFIRNATLLGMAAASAFSLAGMVSPAKLMASQPKRGGVWTCAMGVKRIDHPARLSWAEGGNIIRQLCEYLTFTGPDNITVPYLLEKWRASEDVKTWDLYLKKGITFNNGDLLTADDVMFTIKEWLTKDTGSSMFSLLSYWGGYQNVEKVDDYHIRVHLEKPNIAVPEHFFNLPGFILHRDFEGDIIKKPVGTGPFLLKEFREGERAVFNARKDYWKKGVDGNPLPYIDQIIYLDINKDAAVAALSAGQVDSAFKPRPADLLTAKGLPHVATYSVDSASTYVIGMRVDQAPWDDNRVRTALKLCQDRKKLMRLATMGEGMEAIDAHVAPIHPEWCEKPIPKADIGKAKALLSEYAKEKGLSLPLKVTLATKNDAHESEIAQGLKQMAAPAGFDIQLDITEPSKYWSRWTEVPFGITSWAHRPLGIMVLSLAYTKVAIGAWNETHWHDDEFEAELDKAQKILDPKERSKVMCRIEEIMQERGPIAIPFYLKMFVLCNKKFKNVFADPAYKQTFTHAMWIDA